MVAQNAQGPSDNSVTLSVLSAPAVTPTVALTPPPGFSPTPNTTPAYPPLVWISGLSYPTTDVNSYVIYRSTDPGFTWSTFAATAGNPVSFVGDSQAVSGFTNYYQVIANNGQGVTANSTPAFSGFTSVNVWPNPPKTLNTFPNASAVTLLWSPPIGNVTPTSYDIYRSTSPTTTPTLLATVTAPATLYTDSSVTQGVPYFYWVDVQATGLVSATTMTSALPVAPVTLQITPGPLENILNWSPVSLTPSAGVTGCVVYRMTISTPTPSQTPVFAPINPSIILGVSNTAVTDTSVSDAVSYVYEVAPAAQISGINVLGPFSNPVSQLVLPQPVTNLVAVSGDQLAQLRWNYQGVASITYVISRKLGTAPDSSYQVLQSGFRGVNYLDTGLLDKTFYTYQIVTVDAGGLSSNAAFTTALPAKPPIVNNPAMSLSQGQTQAPGQPQTIGNYLSWNPADTTSSGSVTFDPTTMYPLGGYHIYRSPNGGGSYDMNGTYEFIGTAGVSQTNFLDQVQLVNGSTYTYLVKAFDVPPDVDPTNPNLIHETAYNPITAYPLKTGTALDRNAIRPFGAGNEQVVHIRYVVTNPGNVNIKVYTLNGTFVKELLNASRNTGVYNDLSWDAHNRFGSLVASGVYLITTEMNGHQEIDKVAVIK